MKLIRRNYKRLKHYWWVWLLLITLVGVTILITLVGVAIINTYTLVGMVILITLVGVVIINYISGCGYFN